MARVRTARGGQGSRSAILGACLAVLVWGLCGTTIGGCSSSNDASASGPVPGAAAGPSSNELIEAAVASGKISAELGLVYQVFADFGDARLPAEYQGTSAAGGTAVLAEVTRLLDTFSQTTRDTLAPFLRPPSAPGSWLDLPSAAGAVSPQTFPHGIGSTKSALTADRWTKFPAVSGKVKVWSEIQYGEEALAQQLAGEIDAVIWPKLFGELKMREPISDATVGSDNGDDGAIDIYLVHLGRKGDYGVTASYFNPCGPIAPPSYVLINSQKPAAVLPPTVAHEVMHVSQNLYARKSCSGHSWWNEASATWAEDFTYPALDSEHEYAKSLLSTLDVRHLDDNDEDSFASSHAYGAYLFPFMVVRAYSRPRFVARTWELSESAATSLQAIESALEEVEPDGFKTVWSEFAKRSWNQKPVVDYETWDRVIDQPTADVTLVVNDARKTPLSTNVGHLSARYTRISIPSPQVLKLTIDNTLVRDAASSGHVWLIPRIAGAWSAPEELGATKHYCRNKPEEKVEEIILVISNSEWQDTSYKLPDNGIEVSSSLTGCGIWTGTTNATTVNTTADGTLTENLTTSIVYEIDDTPHSGKQVQYRIQGGSYTYRADFASANRTPPCRSFATAAGPMQPGLPTDSSPGSTSGNLIIYPSAGGQPQTYTGGAQGYVMANQTSNCNDANTDMTTTPLGFTQWWTSAGPGPYLIKPDGVTISDSADVNAGAMMHYAWSFNEVDQ